MNEPRIMRLSRRTLDLPAYQNRQARPDDYRRLITEPTIVVDAETEQVQLVYLAPIADDTHVLVDVLRHTDIPQTVRMSGLASDARVFGYRQRNPQRNPDCAPAALAADDPAGHAVICAFAGVVANYYQHYGPVVFARHADKAKHVLPAWTLEGGPFTSGIVNRDSALAYHFDTGNFRGVWSGMLGFKRDVTGGYLAVPEYDLGLEVADGSLTLFDGQGLLHGVTPFVKTSPQGYRYTIVYYSLEQMWKCLPPGEEAKRIRRLRREHR